MTNRILKYAEPVCRLLFSLVFIVSGFVKAVDPWGTALKMDEYLGIYGLEVLQPWSMFFSIWMCGAELMMGCMLLCKVRVRLISILALIAMHFFTVLTLLSATWFPVEECGCFGDAFHLSPWASFAKNLVLLPLAWVMWYRYRGQPVFTFSRREVTLMCTFFVLTMGLGTWCWLHLPLIDFLPYRTGVDLRNGRFAEPDDAEPAGETVLICRNRHTGELRRFGLTDAEWQDEALWEWVDTRTEGGGTPVVRASLSEFVLRDLSGSDVTDEVLAGEGTLYLLCVTNLNRIPERCADRMDALVQRARAEGAAVVCVTPDALPGTGCTAFGTLPVPCCNIDAKTMKTLLRARNGVVTLRDGVIVDKRNCRDIPLSRP